MADLTKDPFEEFEFRPINEGLGFHRKNKAQTSTQNVNYSATASTSFNTYNPTPTATPAKRESFNINANIPSSFTAPLPRHTTPTPNQNRGNFNIPTIEDDSIAKAQTAVNEILRNLNHKRQLDFVNEADRMQDFKKSKPMLFAAGLDAMLIFAAFLMSMIVMLTITKVDLFLNLTHPETSGLIYTATSMLFIAVAFVYMVVNRAFMGFTPGEWAFDQRCGKDADMENLMYIPRLALRTLIVTATGFIIIPMLSYLFNKDIAGQLSGVNLFRKANAL